MTSALRRGCEKAGYYTLYAIDLSITYEGCERALDQRLRLWITLPIESKIHIRSLPVPELDKHIPPPQ